MTTEQEILSAAIAAYGATCQVDQLCEECAELIVAVNHMRRGRITPADLIEELADVEIMLDQMKLIFPEGEWAAHREAKLERLKNRLEA